jgi:hypothetical protein
MMRTRKQKAGNFHAVRFYKDAEGLTRIVADFLAEGLAATEPAVVIATPVHLAGIDTQLRERGIDVDAATGTGGLVLLDAEATLSEFMVDGMPDGGRFRQAIIPILDRASGGSADRNIRAYGEMVDVLWKSGQSAAAIRLETLWNALANSHAFSLLCGYAMGNFYKDSAVDDICSHHSHVVSDTGQAALVN